MAFSSRHGIVGLINPTMRPGPTEELIRLLPEGIGVIPLFLNIREGTTAEFKRVDRELRAAGRAAGRAEVRPDPPDRRAAVHGAGPQGRDQADRRPGRKNTGRRSSRVPQNHVARAEGAQGQEHRRRDLFPDKLNKVFAGYLRDAGFDVLAHGRRRRAVRQGAGAARPSRSTPTSSAAS